MSYFEVIAQYGKVNEDGKPANIKETYLVQSETFTQAETIITDNLKGYTDLHVNAIKRSKIEEIIDRTSSTETAYYLAKFDIPMIDEITGKTLHKRLSILISANDSKDAHKQAEEFTASYLSDIEITNIDKSRIIGILK